MDSVPQNDHDPQDDAALVPIEVALPELAAADYEDVRKWDAAHMHLQGEYEQADGVYLKHIRNKLTAGANAGSGMWSRYLQARSLTPSMAADRIAIAEGRKRAHLVPGRSVSLLTPGDARVSALEARLAQRDSEYAAVNHQLATAQDMIKRYRAQRTPEQQATAERAPQSRRDSFFGLGLDIDLHEMMRQAKEERAREKAKQAAAKEAARAARAEETPEQRRERLQAQRREAQRREAEEAARERERKVGHVAYYLDLAYEVRPDGDMLQLLTASQRRRLALLRSTAAALLQYLDQFATVEANAPAHDGDEGSEADGD